MHEPLQFGDVTIGENFPAVTIAEAAVEHLGSLNVAMRMAEKARDIGADFIKYQMHFPEEEMIPDIIKFWGGSLDEVLEKYNLSVDDHRALIKYLSLIHI